MFEYLKILNTMKVKEPKKPLFDYLLYRWFNIETPRYKRYWEKYSKFMQYILIQNRTKKVVS